MTDSENQSVEKRKGHLFRLVRSKKFLLIALIVALLVSVAYFVFAYAKTRDELTKAQNPEQAAKIEAEDLAKKLSSFVELPKDEAPTLATVNDAEKLKSQVFFAEAQNGDKVLVYTQARKALLYRPSTQKIIEYAPVALSE